MLSLHPPERAAVTEACGFINKYLSVCSSNEEGCILKLRGEAWWPNKRGKLLVSVKSRRFISRASPMYLPPSLVTYMLKKMWEGEGGQLVLNSICIGGQRR